MILFKYILKNHFAPFIFSNLILFAVLLMQYLMKLADRLIGKGLGFWVITKLIVYSLAWISVLVIPMSVLIATLMAFGSMAQNNEVAILKASGISLYKMMIPPFLAACVVAVLMVQFNNHIYPHTNHEAARLLTSINKQKPTLMLVPGVFSQDVSHFSILAREINTETNNLKDVLIYDNSTPGKLAIVTAEEGKIYFSGDQRKLIMDLTDGEIHESDKIQTKTYRKMVFETHRIAMKADQFSFQEDNVSRRRSEREMGAQEMLGIVDSLEVLKNKYTTQFKEKIAQNILADSIGNTASHTNINNMRYVYLRVKEKIQNTKNTIKTSILRLGNNKKESNKYWVEIHKKYSLPFACIIFILIGAPLGTMTRKGGFGVAAGISLVFFTIYWFFLIGGEKLADRGLISPFWGMWSANILFGILGIFLTYKSTKEQVTINFDFLKKLIPKQLKETSSENANN